MDRGALGEATIVEITIRLQSDHLQALSCSLLCVSELSADHKFDLAINIQVPNFTKQSTSHNDHDKT